MLLLGLVVLAAFIAIAAVCVLRLRGGQVSGGGFDTGAPYNLGLYDSPRYYPYYMMDDWNSWDAGGRCGVACRADGCALACR